MIWQVVLAALCASAVAQVGSRGHTDSGIVITDYHSKLDMTSQNPVETISLKVSNKSPSAVSSIQVLIPLDRKVIGASAEDAYGQKLGVKELSQTINVLVDGKNMVEFRQFEITPQQPISPEYDLKIPNLKFVYNSFYAFKPKTTDLFDSQKVLVTIFKMPASPYRIENAVSDLIYGDTKRTENFQGKDLPPYTATSTRLHFPLNIHFVHSSTTTRYIEISHWGNIYFKDQYLLHNRASKFRGEFSTLDFNKHKQETGRNAFRSARIRLPSNAWGLFYRDEIGNITTSAVTRRVRSDYVVGWNFR